MEQNTFEIRYNVTGGERKRLVRAMGDFLEAEPKYLGAPSFAYENDYFTVDKTGTVTFDSRADSEEIEKLIERLHELGFKAEKTGSETNDDDELVIEMPLTGFTPEKLDNLAKLVNAKESLLKAALGVHDLPIQQTENTLRFPWFKESLDSDSVHAYATLISKLCETAKEKDIVYIFAGLPEGYESEGFDRKGLELPPEHNRLIEAVTKGAAAQGWDKSKLHAESFSEAAPQEGDEPFDVELANSGQVLTVPADQTLLEALEASGTMVIYDCRKGDCGLCSVQVKSGEIIHRDIFLSDEEKASGTVIQVCVSRGKGRLVLDL
jgi:ferredoxin